MEITWDISHTNSEIRHVTWWSGVDKSFCMNSVVRQLSLHCSCFSPIDQNNRLKPILRPVDGSLMPTIEFGSKFFI